MNYILILDKTLSALAGYAYGQQIFREQIKPKISDYNSDFNFEFPENIEYLASSFVQGFFSDLVEQIGFSGVEDKVDIMSKNPNITKENVMGKLFEGTTN